MERTEIFIQKPLDFEENLVVSGGFIMHDDRFLMLKRHPEKPSGNLWNLPAGKVELNEDPKRGAQREIFEETGIHIPLDELHPVNTFYIKRSHHRIRFHVYKSILKDKPDLTLKIDENTEALWTNPEEAFELPLLGGGQIILDYCVKKPI